MNSKTVQAIRWSLRCFLAFSDMFCQNYYVQSNMSCSVCILQKQPAQRDFLHSCCERSLSSTIHAAQLHLTHLSSSSFKPIIEARGVIGGSFQLFVAWLRLGNWLSQWFHFSFSNCQHRLVIQHFFQCKVTESATPETFHEASCPLKLMWKMCVADHRRRPNNK